MASSSKRRLFIYVENLLFSVATFINDPNWFFWISYCNFYLSTCCFTLHLYVMEMAFP